MPADTDLRLLSKPLPSLAAWLGDGARAEQFEEWLIESTAASKATTGIEASTVRIIQTLSIACIEALRREYDLGRPVEETMQLLPRAAGAMVMAALLNASKEDKASVLRLLKLTVEEFGHGARKIALSATKRK